MSNELIRIAAEDYALCLHGPHGPAHWARVIENGKALAAMYGVNPRIPELFGAFHDCRRITENYDINHGARGAQALVDRRNRYGLTSKEFSTVVMACAFHATARPEGDWPLEARICFDANRLDLLRVGITPHPLYLFTEFAKMQSVQE